MPGQATGKDFRSPPEESRAATGNLAQSDRNPSSGEPTRTDKNRESRAREADGPDGSASPDEPDDQADNELVNAHWRARQDDIAKAFERNQLNWLRACIPHADDGEMLILAVPDRWFGEQIDQRVGRSSLERVVGRRIKFLPTAYAKGARQRRLGKAAQADDG